LGDIIQSIGVVVAAIIIYFRPDLIIFDPICTFIFSIIVLITTYKVTKQCVLILMEAVPHNIKLETIKKEITKNVHIL
jgi:zinc transporter 2